MEPGRVIDRDSVVIVMCVCVCDCVCEWESERGVQRTRADTFHSEASICVRREVLSAVLTLQVLERFRSRALRVKLTLRILQCTGKQRVYSHRHTHTHTHTHRGHGLWTVALLWLGEKKEESHEGCVIYSVHGRAKERDYGAALHSPLLSPAVVQHNAGVCLPLGWLELRQ